MTPVRPRRLALIVVALVLSACGFAEPSTRPSEATVADSLVIGCASIEAVECQFVAEQIEARLPAARGRPFAIEVTLFGCDNAACPPTLAVRTGMAIAEYLDGGEPVQLSLRGPPQQPAIAIDANTAWSGLIQPSSLRIGGPGRALPYQVGHCGLSHIVDFDGSFWIPIGQLDGDASVMINSESGLMGLAGENLAVYRGANGFSAQLARFPGPKHFWLCA